MSRSSKLSMLAAVVVLVSCSADGPTAIPDAGPILLNIVSGDVQKGDPGVELGRPLVVLATDEKGKPVKGQLVNFVVVAGGGSLFAGSSITDTKGQAQDYWTLGPSGDQKVEVRAVDPSTGEKHTYATFTATFNPPPDIDADGDGYLGSVDCNDAAPAVHPGAQDSPDDAFVDSNCDGVDGDKATAVFVSRTGFNVASCGTIGAPCESITYGIQQAIALGRPNVFIGMGDYPETVTLSSGINLFGGYAANFSSRSLDSRATVSGSASLDGTPGQLFTMLASGLTLPTEVSALVIRGGDAPAGATSHALVIRNDPGNFRLSQARIIAGNGGNGVAGAAGSNGLLTPAPNGANGGSAGSVGVCDDNTRGTGGAGAFSSAGGGTGGRGGNGGQADIDCRILSLNLNARAGQDGSNGFPSALPFGLGGNGGAPCVAGQNGTDGRTTHGADGAGGDGLTVIAGFVVTAPGTAGALGLNGTGGGGGGGSGGCDDGADAFGAGGGGGGAGGAMAPTSGAGGGGGGASVGIFVINATPTLVAVEIVRGRGGNGGAGGNGGRGQLGGAGGAGGAGVNGSRPGGNGGRGADGGNSGSGGGGAGGASIGILTTAGSVVADGSVTYSGGAGGVGGAGGIGPQTAAPAGMNGAVATKIAK